MTASEKQDSSSPGEEIALLCPSPACLPREMRRLQSVRFRLLWILYKPWDFSLQQTPVQL